MTNEMQRHIQASIGRSEADRAKAQARIARRQQRDIAAKLFDASCAVAGIPIPVHNYKFHDSKRGRFHICWPELEIGVVFLPSGRSVPRSLQNLTAMEGWRLLVCQEDELEKLGMVVRVAKEG